MTDCIFTLRGRAAWAHDFNTDRSIGATFQTLPGASFVVNGAAQARDAALMTASAEMKWLNGLSLAATFEGEFSNSPQLRRQGRRALQLVERPANGAGSSRRRERGQVIADVQFLIEIDDDAERTA